MVKLAVGLLVAVVGVGAGGAARAGAGQVFTGSIDSASDVDLFRFCAAGGDIIVLTLDGAGSAGPTPFRANVSLLDENGATLPSFTGSFRAPQTGLYFGRVAAEADGTIGDYRLGVAVNGDNPLDVPVDLSVAQSQSPDSVSAGGTLRYTVTVDNAGPGTANYATILDPIPVGTTFVSASWTGPEENWECTVPPVGANGKVSCLNKCFEAGGSVVFTIDVKVNACTGNVQLQNLVTATTSSQDQQPGNNVSSLFTTVFDPRTCDDGSACTAGDACAPGTAFAEDFDLIVPRDLPTGWTATLVVGPLGATGWRTGTGSVFSAPNAVFAPDAPDVRDAVLDSPAIRIVTSNTQVLFRNRYELELQADGGVFEVKLGNGMFVDIEDAGGQFVTGGYNATISDDFQSPIAGRRAWTGSSHGFIETIVNLPPALVGQDVVLRWRMATDMALGNIGQWIDSIVVTGIDACQPGAVASCDDNDACTIDSCDARDGCRHAALSCDDGNPCTNDACDAVVQCVHSNAIAACDDHDACTTSDACVSGVCVGTNPLACLSTDVCAAAACDETLGCVTATADFDATGFSAGRVDGRDLAVMAAAWNSCPGEVRYNPSANLERQGACVDLPDFHLFMNAFGRSCSP